MPLLVLVAVGWAVAVRVAVGVRVPVGVLVAVDGVVGDGVGVGFRNGYSWPWPPLYSASRSAAVRARFQKPTESINQSNS